MAHDRLPKNDPRNMAAEPSEDQVPLRAYGGVKPPAPGWFNAAIETPFETRTVEVEGAELAYQVWGDETKPGLLLVHGNGAHAHWWDFIAPLFMDDYQVVAPTF
ncbi:MAG: alpha/beta hydrolase, partial [Henriciella sp.]